MKAGIMTAGTIDAMVYADKPGSQFNTGTTDFTIPGFKSDASRYQKIVGRSKTDISGGLSIGDPSLSGPEIAQATTKLQTDLRDQLIRQIKSQKPVDTILFDGAYTIDFAPITETKTATPSKMITEQATIHGIVLNKKTLSQTVLGSNLASIGDNVEVRGLESLVFTAATSTASKGSLWEQNPLKFSLSGTLQIIGLVNKANLLTDLAGISTSDLQKVLKKYPTIDHVSSVIRPFWNSQFPTDMAKIKVQIVDIP